MDQPRGRNMRLVALGTVLIALTAGYILLLRNFNVSELPSERHFGAADPVVPAGEVYLEPISIDALNDAWRCAPICRQACRKAKTLTSPRIAI
jgi:hypothetical protein